jgi:fructose-1,6-bisphosphatase/inositol monophosphatase family enzyme
MASPYERELLVMKRAVANAGKVALAYFNGDLGASHKDDDSPITLADPACERLITKELRNAFPTYGILGEEDGVTHSSGAHAGNGTHHGRRFLIDPIDGTNDFILGMPEWGVMLALEVDGEVVGSVVALPALGRTYWAEKGQGAFRQDAGKKPKRMHASTHSTFGGSKICVFASLDYFGFKKKFEAAAKKEGNGKRPMLLRTVSMLLATLNVAEGRIDASFGKAPWPWDLAPTKIILEEAGGRYSNQNDDPSIYCKPGFYTNTGDWVFQTNGKIHSKLIKAVKPVAR